MRHVIFHVESWELFNDVEYFSRTKKTEGLVFMIPVSLCYSELLLYYKFAAVINII